MRRGKRRRSTLNVSIRFEFARTTHTLAVESIAKLLAAAEPVYFTLQNIAEFWNVATRPVANNGLGFSVQLVLGEVEKSSGF